MDWNNPIEIKENEKRSQLDQPRQAKDKPAKRLFFNLLDGWAFDLERLVGAARQHDERQ
ncbi:hypothetical protein [Bacillus sp. FJAT-42315]|uniref:hypothetical protein n=1 Tax=Bacillus sp. FJAT-42315 TaxID=2014077 RepID=UPI0012FF4260|nr:hypothetical protein [Bacillus sp. FJAT-42315]